MYVVVMYIQSTKTVINTMATGEEEEENYTHQQQITYHCHETAG